jgi:hypothetical protein
MRMLRHLLTLALVSVACASKLDVRQATNTNVAFNKIIDNVDVTMHQSWPHYLYILGCGVEATQDLAYAVGGSDDPSEPHDVFGDASRSVQQAQYCVQEYSWRHQPAAALPPSRPRTMTL